MLAGQHLGGGQKQGLTTAVGRSGQGEAGHDGLARAHVAEKHVVGRRRRGEHPQDIVPRPFLLAGEDEGQRPGKGRHTGTVHDMGHGLAVPGSLGPLLHEEELQIQQLLVDEPAPGLVGLGRRGREMDGGQGGLPPHEAIAQAQPQGQRVEGAPDLLQAVGHNAAHPRGRKLLGGRVHRHHGAGQGRPFPAPDHLDEGVGHALVAVVEGHLARHGHRIPGLDLVHEPRLAKSSHHDDTRAVHQGNLHELQVVTGLLQLDLVHGAANGARLADMGARAALHARQVDIGSGEVGHQIAHRANTQLL